MSALPGPLGMIGKKHIQLATKWIPSAALYGGTAGTLLCYFTDWRLIVEHIPFYNGKFPKEEEKS